MATTVPQVPQQQQQQPVRQQQQQQSVCPPRPAAAATPGWQQQQQQQPVIADSGKVVAQAQRQPVTSQTPVERWFLSFFFLVSLSSPMSCVRYSLCCFA